ncbi:YusW family protein [Niallia sp. Krafla_26]|uniref:YusW family protein n=1 Tax=Niallia sp. Krafla_26 TaxID=3064703 RepID=UPI003D168B3B
MKKVTSALLSAILTVNFTVPVFAQEVKEPTPVVKNIEGSESLKNIYSFKATVVFEDERYHVTYLDKDGIVSVDIKKDTGKEEIKITGEDAHQRVIKFVKDLNLTKNLSKEEVVKRLSAAIGKDPSELEKADADITFTNDATISFSYKQGNKSKTVDKLELRQLQVKLEANDGSFYDIHYHLKGNGDIQAMVKKKTEDGEERLKDLDALNEINRIFKNGLIPNNETNLNEYLEQVSVVVGIPVTDITKADFRGQFTNKSKVDFKFEK